MQTLKDSNCASLLSLSVDDFLSRAGERMPAPGGGAVAATTAALAVAMGRMVTAYSPGPQTLPDQQEQLDELGRQLARLDRICRGLVDEDAAAYEAYSSASRKVKANEAPPETLQSAVRLVISIPLEVQAMSLSLLRLLNEHKTILKSALYSDLAVAAHLAAAACQAARETALINVFELDSEDDRTHLYRQCDHFVEVAKTLADQIVSFVHR